MIKHEYADMFQQDSIHKDFTIAFDGGTITNEDLHQESIELSESICSESKLRFGCCESSVFKFTVSNIVTPLKNKKIKVSVVLDRLTENALKIGEYKVVSDKPNADRNYRDIVAYDALHDVLHAEVAEWYNSLSFPMSLKQFRTAFFVYFGIEQEEITLVNDEMVVEKTIEPESISGKDVITAICEINGCFGNIGRNGKFRYVILEALSPGLYPENTLYPQNALYPRETNANTILKKHYISCEYEDFTTQKISKLQIRQEENDVGAIAGSGSNCYIVQDNFLVYGKSAEDLNDVAEKLLSVISIPEYRPFNASLRGNPCMQVGELVVFSGKREMVQSYILERTLKGIQSLRDTFYADGEEENTEEINSIKSSIIQLKGKTNKLTRTVDETRLEMTDMEAGLRSEITVTAADLRAEFENADDELSTRITANANGLSIEITDRENADDELSTRITANANAILFKVESDEVESMIAIALDEVVIDSEHIKLEGYTTINGGFSVNELGQAVLRDGNTTMTVAENGVIISHGSGTTIYGTSVIALDSKQIITVSDVYGISIGTSDAALSCKTLNGYTPITSNNIDSYVTDYSSDIELLSKSYSSLSTDVMNAASDADLALEGVSDNGTDIIYIKDRLDTIEEDYLTSDDISDLEGTVSTNTSYINSLISSVGSLRADVNSVVIDEAGWLYLQLENEDVYVWGYRV
ncbi:MAG: hypothetical protein IJZ23_07605 [Roseburia sp.]|nr:hypothetical protein [Roseburia sp.]